MRAFCLVITMTIACYAPLQAQKQDSLQQIIYQSALQKLKDGNYAEASAQLSQLIANNFANKEVFVKRGVAAFMLNDFAKSKIDLDEAVKARINTEELFEYRGLARYRTEDYTGASADLDKAVAMGGKRPD